MTEPRVWLRTGAMVMGLGAALLSGSGVANADGGGADDGSGGKPASTGSSPAKSGQAAANNHRPAQGTAGRSSAAPTRTKPAPSAVATPVDRTPQLDLPEIAPAATAVADPAPPVPVEFVASSPKQAAAATARRASVNQALASAGSLTATPAPALAPTAGLAATLLGVLSGLAVPPRPAAAATAAPLAVVPTLPLLPGYTNGVTGVQVGHSRLEMPGAFIGDTVAADWYFPTQADGRVDAQGVIWLQHGFGATNTFYSALATELAMKTNSIVVSPTLSSIPFTFSGGCLTCSSSQEAAAAIFLEADRTTLVQSALDAGLNPLDVGGLEGSFILAGHSAGGGFAAATAADFLNAGNPAQDDELAGVVMFDGVSNGASDGSFAAQVDALQLADVPIYQIAAPAQAWNAYGATTNALLTALGDASTTGGTFAGVVLAGGSHVDSMLGVNPIFDAVLQLVTGRVPAGNTAAVYILSTGWINDMYAGLTPDTAEYGFYAGANQAIIMGPTAAIALPTPIANQLSLGNKIVTSLIDAVGGIFGFSILPDPVNTGNNGVTSVQTPPLSNGVTGVRTGSAVLDIPCGPNGYAAPADWYFPTQADGTVQANGVIWLQHGFLGFKSWYAAEAQQLAQETNSIVVVPNIFWFDTPLCPGCFLGGEEMRKAAATMLTGDKTALTISANAAGLDGPLPQQFLLTGHSAGGNFATAVGALVVQDPEYVAGDLLGVVMYDGVSGNPLFTDSLTVLNANNIPDYQIAGKPQDWNAWGVATDLMYEFYGDQFYGVQIDDGSHTDVIAGPSLFAKLAEIASAIIVNPSPPGAKEAVRTFSSGWINDIYAGNTAYLTNAGEPLYGIYGRNGETPMTPVVANQPIVMGEAGASTLPSPPPVDLLKYDGKWYEQGSVKQFFSIGLVNTTATYTPQPDGSIKVENSGNYFGPNGPQSNITGAALVVNPGFNTRLNVGFFFGQPNNTDEPGNYWILDYGPEVDGEYEWAIVSDSSGRSGYILTRDQTITEAEYNELVARAKQLGVSGRITPTAQYPAAAVAALPGPAQVPASVTV